MRISDAVGVFRLEPFQTNECRKSTPGDVHPAKGAKGLPLFDARAGVTLPADFEVSPWGANVADEHCNSVIFNAPSPPGSDAGAVGAPRTFGIDLCQGF